MRDNYRCGTHSRNGERPKVSVTLENEEGQTKLVSVEDAWLSDNGLNVGDAWPMQGIY